jgi:hypothetical protein
VIFTAIVATAIWWVVGWRYDSIVASKDSIIGNRDAQISLLTTQRDDYRDKLGGASPAEARARLDALEKSNAKLTENLSRIAKQVGPEYPLSEDEKGRLLKVLSQVPQNPRFHVDVFWPQINGFPRYADAVSQVLLSAKWDTAVKAGGLSFSHGIVFAFGQQTYNDESKRSSEALKLMDLFRQAEIRYSVVPLDLVVPFAFIVGPPE